MADVLGHTIIGNGPEKVIVVGGWMGDHTVFAPTFPYLDTATFTYAFLDPRGYGASREQAGRYTLAEMAGDVLAFADAQDWERFHLIGHSMSGMLAQYVSARSAARVQSAIGIAPVPASGVPMSGETLALFENAWQEPANRGLICMITTGNRHTPQWEQLMIHESLRTTTPEAFRQYFYMWTTTNVAAEVQGCQTPFLAVVGEHDQAITPAVISATVLEWMPRAELHLMTNAGHYPMMETPIQLVTVCEHFMQAHR